MHDTKKSIIDLNGLLWLTLMEISATPWECELKL